MTTTLDAGELNERAFLDPAVIVRLLKFADFAVVWAATCSAIYYVTPVSAGGHATPFFVAILNASLVLYGIRALKLYTPSRLSRLLPSIGGAACVTLAVSVVANLLVYSVGLTAGTWWIWTAVAAVPYYAASRVFVCPWVLSMKEAGRLTRRVAIVGGGKYAEEAINLLSDAEPGEFEILGLFDDRTDDRSPESIRRYRKIGRISDLADFARKVRVDQIIVTIPQSAETRLLTVLKRLWELPVDIKVSAHSSRLRLTPRSYSYLGSLPLLSLFDRPVSGWDALMKTVFDRTAGALLLVAASPVLLATALAVRLESKGPVIFRQQRYGFNNELITVYKFRSMYTDMTDQNASKLVTKDDPRVTKVGKFIRKTSLDELPQLFNVLEGKMSLVGPRPHAKSAKAENELYEEVVDGYFARHRIKPGITGLAQIKGYRGETDTREKIEKRVQYDLEYMDRWSVLFDLYIVLMTPVSLIIKNENAY